MKCYRRNRTETVKLSQGLDILLLLLFISEHSVDLFYSERFSCDIVAFFTTAFRRSLYKCSFLRNFNLVILDFMSRMRQHKLHPSKQQSFPSAFSLFCDIAKFKKYVNSFCRSSCSTIHRKLRFPPATSLALLYFS